MFLERLSKKMPQASLLWQSNVFVITMVAIRRAIELFWSPNVRWLNVFGHHRVGWSKFCIVVTYEIRVFFEGAKKEVFSSIFKKAQKNVKYAYVWKNWEYVTTMKFWLPQGLMIERFGHLTLWQLKFFLLTQGRAIEFFQSPQVFWWPKWVEFQLPINLPWIAWECIWPRTLFWCDTKVCLHLNASIALRWTHVCGDNPPSPTSDKNALATMCGRDE
jgi:hypothetical protein